MCWVYLLLCSDGSYYVGSTVDIQARLFQHQTGVGPDHTRKRRPVVLVWTAEFASKREAFAFERRVHGWRRQKKEALIEGRWEALPELASRSWDALRARARGMSPEPDTAVIRPLAVEREPWPVEGSGPVDPDDPWASPFAPPVP